MSNKFPPRVYLSNIEENHEVLLERNSEEEEEYLSLTEHEAILAGLENRIELAVELLSKMEKTKCKYNNRETVRCTCLLDGIVMALAKLKATSNSRGFGNE